MTLLNSNKKARLSKKRQKLIRLLMKPNSNWSPRTTTNLILKATTIQRHVMPRLKRDIQNYKIPVIRVMRECLSKILKKAIIK